MHTDMDSPTLLAKSCLKINRGSCSTPCTVSVPGKMLWLLIALGIRPPQTRFCKLLQVHRRASRIKGFKRVSRRQQHGKGIAAVLLGPQRTELGTQGLKSTRLEGNVETPLSLQETYILKAHLKRNSDLQKWTLSSAKLW